MKIPFHLNVKESKCTTHTLLRSSLSLYHTHHQLFLAVLRELFSISAKRSMGGNQCWVDPRYQEEQRGSDSATHMNTNSCEQIHTNPLLSRMIFSKTVYSSVVYVQCFLDIKQLHLSIL